MANTIVVGGKSYRWKGRSIRTFIKDNYTCVSLPKRDSMIMTQVNTIPDAKYEIKILASKSSGNGKLFLNFFGGKYYDGKPETITIQSSEFYEYTVFIIAPKSPPNIPINLRAWKPDNSPGNIVIKYISYCLSTIKENSVPKVAPVKQDQIIKTDPSKISGDLFVYNPTTSDVMISDLGIKIKAKSTMDIYRANTRVSDLDIQTSLREGSLFKRISAKILRIVNSPEEENLYLKKI